MSTGEHTCNDRPLRAAPLHVVLPLVVGSLTYVLARHNDIRVFTWLDAAGLSSAVAQARSAAHPVVVLLPGWLRFSVPSALWVYAFAWMLSALWGPACSRSKDPSSASFHRSNRDPQRAIQKDLEDRFEAALEGALPPKVKSSNNMGSALK